MSDDSWSVSSMVRRAVPLLIVLSLLELGSGLVLENLGNSLLEYPSLLVLIPSIIGMAGNLGSVLSSRITTGLHLGTVNFSERVLRGRVLSDSVGVLMHFFTLSVVMGLFSYGFGRIMGGGIGFLKILKVSVLTSMVLGLLVVILSVSVVYFAYVRGLDPDDVAIPVVTNVSDITGVLVFAGVVVIFV